MSILRILTTEKNIEAIKTDLTEVEKAIDAVCQKYLPQDYPKVKALLQAHTRLSDKVKDLVSHAS